MAADKEAGSGQAEQTKRRTVRQWFRRPRVRPARRTAARAESPRGGEARAVARYVRIAPQKVRLVADLVRGKPVEEVEMLLRFVPKRAARVIQKVVKSAAANAEHNLDLDRASLYVAGIYVDGGPVLKRWHPRQRGRAYPILKRTSHVTVVVRAAGEGR